METCPAEDMQNSAHEVTVTDSNPARRRSQQVVEIKAPSPGRLPARVLVWHVHFVLIQKEAAHAFDPLGFLFSRLIDPGRSFQRERHS